MRVCVPFAVVKISKINSTVTFSCHCKCPYIILTRACASIMHKAYMATDSSQEAQLLLG